MATPPGRISRTSRAAAATRDGGHARHPAGLTGPNPFRLVDQNTGALGVQYSCSAATGRPCHAGTPRSTARRPAWTSGDHDAHRGGDVDPGGYTAKRTWPAWTVQGAVTGLECANCHDPHGDGNLSMVNRWVYDKGPFLLPAPAPVAPTEQTRALVHEQHGGCRLGLVRRVAGPTNYSGICQECHEDASVVSFKDDSAGGTVSEANHPYAGTNPGDCSSCHRHDRAFRPTACEDCHERARGQRPDAPNVMPFYNVNGHGAKTFDPDGRGPLGTRAVDFRTATNSPIRTRAPT